MTVNTVYIDGINVLNKEDFAFFNKTFFSINFACSSVFVADTDESNTFPQ